MLGGNNKAPHPSSFNIAVQRLRLKAMLALSWFWALPLPRKLPLLAGLALLLSYFVLWWNQDGEEIFWVTSERRVMSVSEWWNYRGQNAKISAAAAAVLARTPAGSLALVDKIFVPHWKGLPDRERSMTADLLSFNLTNFEYRTTWDRKQVLARKQLVAERFFTVKSRLIKRAHSRVACRLHRTQSTWWKAVLFDMDLRAAWTCCGNVSPCLT